uniref:Uncharacterized protein n=1 Tax=Anopheles atroparvus TaxID=41427 RepID=A0A182IW27_ANOAO
MAVVIEPVLAAGSAARACPEQSGKRIRIVIVKTVALIQPLNAGLVVFQIVDRLGERRRRRLPPVGRLPFETVHTGRVLLGRLLLVVALRPYRYADVRFGTADTGSRAHRMETAAGRESGVRPEAGPIVEVMLILGHAGRVDQIELQVLGQLARPDLLRGRPVLAVAPASMLVMRDDTRVRLRSRLSVSDRFRRFLERCRRCFRCELCDRPDRPEPRLISLSLSDTRRLRCLRRRPDRDSFDEWLSTELDRIRALLAGALMRVDADRTDFGLELMPNRPRCCERIQGALRVLRGESGGLIGAGVFAPPFVLPFRAAGMLQVER